ncbi:unnamed protein product, partial [Didymodactylos carnosus]
GLKKQIMKCHHGYRRPYPGAAENKVMQQKLRELVKYGLRGTRNAEFDPVEHSPVSSSTSSIDGDEDGDFEKENCKVKQVIPKGNSAEIQINLPQPTYATDEEQSSRINSVDEDGNRSEDDNQESTLNLSQMDLSSIISPKFKSTNTCKSILRTQIDDNDATVTSAKTITVTPTDATSLSDNNYDTTIQTTYVDNIQTFPIRHHR